MEKRDASCGSIALSRAIDHCDCIVIGAGAGLSTSAGFVYAGERFERYFGDFGERYGFGDMYTGGFYPYRSPEEHWAYWSRFIWVNRYAPIPKDTYSALHDLVHEKDFFVITTNVDHCFQRAGFDKKQLFYTQGDYGLFQCSFPCCNETWGNYDQVRAMVEAQGFKIKGDGMLDAPGNAAPLMSIPSELLPICPKCGRPLTMNLRADDRFVEDEGWREASMRYGDFLRSHVGKGRRMLFLELGVGGNTPAIIKYPFWRMASCDSNVTYACVNLGEAYAPEEIRDRSILVDKDIDEVIQALAASEKRGGCAHGDE